MAQQNKKQIVPQPEVTRQKVNNSPALRHIKATEVGSYVSRRMSLTGLKGWAAKDFMDNFHGQLIKGINP